ncbi:hypothetical protein U724_06885 [Pseudomonas chlororaphis subsp. aurantiaca PB-St2]|nr:hypothetical protein U724_06885 [Pseudomonas chlororaphis subsp. aurantiaca PB-St2]
MQIRMSQPFPQTKKPKHIKNQIALIRGEAITEKPRKLLINSAVSETFKIDLFYKPINDTRKINSIKKHLVRIIKIMIDFI